VLLFEACAVPLNRLDVVGWGKVALVERLMITGKLPPELDAEPLVWALVCFPLVFVVCRPNIKWFLV
jgi:hypothetical protein